MLTLTINDYNNNEKFKEYVDKYSKLKKITIREALSHELVKQYYLSVMPGGVNAE